MGKRRFIIVVGASAGGTVALPELFRQLTADMNVAVFVVLHLAKKSIGRLITNRLQKYTTYKCTLPRHKETIKSGHIYIARPDHHMMIKGSRILIGKGPMENRYRPSIDALFRSAAVEHDSHTIGIILSGMLEDGTSGMMAIKQSGGTCIIQDPDEAKHPDMPLSVAKNMKPDFSIPVEHMGDAIRHSLGRSLKRRAIPKQLVQEARIAERVNIGIDHVKDLGTHSLYSCPDCGGGLWQIDSNGESGYRCHVGHAYSEVGLLSAMEATTEAALWTALRIIEERKNLLQRAVAKHKGARKSFTHLDKQVVELKRQIDQIKKVLLRGEYD